MDDLEGYRFLGHAYPLRFTPDGRGLIADCAERIMRWAVGGGNLDHVRASLSALDHAPL